MPAPESPPAAGRSVWTDDLPWIAGLFLLVAAVYARALAGELVYDDLLIVGRNPVIADLSRLPELLVRPYWDFVEPEKAIQIGYWRPLSSIAIPLAYAAGGGGTAALHAVGIGAHLLSTALVFVLARRLGGTRSVALFAAALFGLHPVQVEAVAWISALADPLVGLFSLLSMCAFLAWRLAGSRGRPVAAWLWLVPALLTKEQGVAVIPLVAALDLGRPRVPADGPGRGWRAGFVRVRAAYGGYAIVLGLYVLARMAVFASPWAGLERVTTQFNVSFARLQLLRFELVGGALQLLAFPRHLNLFRPFEPVLDAATTWRVIAWTAAGVALLAWATARRKRPLIAGLWIVAAGLVPIVLRLESLGRFPLSDRFLYVPAIGFCFSLSLALHRLLPERVAVGALSVVVALFAWRTEERIGFWKDEETLFGEAAQASPRSPYVLWGHGRVLLERYVETRDKRYLDEAFRVFEKGQDLLQESRKGDADLFVTSNDFLQINLGVGWCYLFEADEDAFGSPATAVAVFQELARSVTALRDQEQAARDLGIEYAGEHLDLERVYVGLGAAQLRAGDLDAAEEALRKALSLNPDFPEAHQYLGRVFAARSEWRQALSSFERALALRPGNVGDRILVAETLQSMGAADRAEHVAQGLVDQGVERREPYVVLATLRLQKGDASGALAMLDHALELAPSDGWTWYLRASAFVLRDSQPEALQAYRRASELLPDTCEVQYDFGSYLLRAGAVDAALEPLVRAYEVCTRQEVVLRLRTVLPTLPVSDPEIYVRLSAVDAGRDEPDLAESWLDAALAIAPDDGAVHLAKGRLLRKRGRTDEALASLARAAELSPRSFLAQSEYGLLLVDAGRAEEGVPILEASLELPRPEGWTADDFAEARERLQKKLRDLRG